MQARRDALRGVGRLERRGERHGEEDGREGGRAWKSLEKLRGIAGVFSVFTYKGLNVGHGMLGWTGLPVVA